MATPYNHIFTKLVQDDPDFVGMVAYALYKKQKIEWIQQFSSQNGGREPNEHELEPFHNMSNMQSMIDSYRNQAVDLLDEFLDFALADKVEQIRQALIQEAFIQGQQTHHKGIEQICHSLCDTLKTAQDAHQQAVFSKVNKPWYVSIFENVVVGLVTSLITLAGAGLIWVATQGPEKLLQDVLQKYTQQPAPAQLSAPANPSAKQNTPS